MKKRDKMQIDTKFVRVIDRKKIEKRKISLGDKKER